MQGVWRPRAGLVETLWRSRLAPARVCRLRTAARYSNLCAPRPPWAGIDIRTGLHRKVTGRTKTEVREKLKKLQAEADAGLKTSASYTVAKAVDDWAAEALDGLAHDVRRALNKLAGSRSTRTMASTHNVLVRGYPARGGQRSRGPERRQLREAAGQDRAAVPGDDRGRGGRAARSGQGSPSYRRLRDPFLDYWHPDRGGPGSAVGSRRPGRRPGCADAGAAEYRGVALGPVARRHQDREVGADPGPAAERRGGAARAPHVAGHRPGVHHQRRHPARRLPRPARLPCLGQEGGHRRSLGATGAPAHVRLGYVRVQRGRRRVPGCGLAGRSLFHTHRNQVC